jgi:phosphoenolpyruvate synthase/pyruvate phosphate dikinase
MAGVIKLGTVHEPGLIGGKAANLAHLMKAGFKVPSGFVVTDLMDGLTDEIAVAFDKLSSEFVAVRSSAVAEDGNKDAWAGQLDTFLRVTKEDLLDKIKACFASAGSERARAYATQKQIDSGKVAVIVQKMIPSEISGVAFSVHPVTKNHGHMVIEAVKGLGEKLVSGTITPDTYVLDKKLNKIIEKYVASSQILKDEYIDSLAEAIKKIESLFNFPVDVEWAFAGKELFILQSRPITTLS